MSRIRLIAIDIGGTLIDEQNKIPKETIKLLNTLCDNGIVIALITARMYSSTKYISNLIGAKYGVFGNGSNVINIVDKCDIYSETFDYNTLKKLINFGKKERLYTHLNEKYFEMSDEKKYFTLKHLILNKDYPEELKSNIKIVKDLYKYIENNGDIIKVIYVSECNMDKILDKIKIELPEVFITEYNRNSKEAVINKTINYIELGKNNTSKADGLEKLINHLDIKSDEVLVIGNDDNDVDMFKKYKNSGCVANGTYSAKKTASYVSNYDNTNGGVCDIIKKYVKVGR